MYRQLCVNWGVKNTIATCFSQFNNNYNVYKHLCQFCVFTYTCRRKLEKASSIPCNTNKTEQKKANYIYSNQI